MWDQMTKKEQQDLISRCEEMGLEKNEWYWITDPRESDVWWPVFVNENLEYMIDNKFSSIINLKNLTIVKAEMP